ncbi:MAG TPA: aminomethyl-transferring glycine dehydrogenase subunit GcvPA [Candidatus Pullichristensenella excrementigallinarum]|uniref:Probable glycine dehydrogenase (decarboxylating) subunit 1 n=1 Tax=Candidatus Pullichristensenella excrementigallinarum TaxID=2840907 RepID=A0A9D1LCB1_9FIRM|nr:aminomethyl-transferring glycine dehydrogenase subunit GcvPA [Candidatus Pullichristensenella excrementigallinarum]
MGGYIPSTHRERREMLSAIGLSSPEELFGQVPASIRYPEFSMEGGLSEMEVQREMEAMAAKNRVYESVFRGAGAYDHYIPAIVGAVTSKETFVTAYTPYQAEISQGILQSIFEYQTMICSLTGMDVSNASVYDGATAAAEAIHMCVDAKRRVALVSEGLHPMALQTVQTYADGADVVIRRIPLKDGATDLSALKSMLTDEIACVLLQSPNFYGQIENAQEIFAQAHANKSKAILSMNPIACALYRTPAELGADIAVGEGQPLGMPLSFGGPYLGFMATGSALMRKLPGRIVGQTTDLEGRRAFVLTLQAREQHIRREKALSNICSNQALCAMTAAVYLAAMGPEGLRGVAEACHAKAAYLREQLAAAGLEPVHGGEFFHEFLTQCPVAPEKLLDALKERGILGGLPLGEKILWCATEKNSRAEIDRLVAVVREVIA